MFDGRHVADRTPLLTAVARGPVRACDTVDDSRGRCLVRVLLRIKSEAVTRNYGVRPRGGRR